jgi:hypothetical protein
VADDAAGAVRRTPRPREDVGLTAAAARLTNGDAEAIHAFRTFLEETPAGVTKALRERDKAALLRCFADADAFVAWRERWLLFASGAAEGPTDATEYADRLAELKDVTP